MSFLDELKNKSSQVDASIALEIGDFLGFCDMNGDEAMSSDEIEKLEKYVLTCQEKHKTGDSIVSDAVYDKMIEILQRVKPDSEYIGRIWDEAGSTELDDTDKVFAANPMYSIQTIKSYDSQALIDFKNMLPKTVDIHASYKENGWGIRLVYQNGTFVKARTRARASQGRDITPQLNEVLEKNNKTYIEAIKDVPLCEIRGELVVSFATFGSLASQVSVRSPFSAVSMLVKESATPQQWAMLDFVAYKFLADGFDFSTKTEEYDFLEFDLGFETPPSWTNTITNDATFIDEIKSIMKDCEDASKNYSYYTDGVVIEVDNTDIARKLGQGAGNYNNYNLAMKVGLWQQDMYEGYVQTILWVKGKTKLSPVALVANDNDAIEFVDGDVKPFIYDIKEIANMDDIGVITAAGNVVRRVPLYEPRNMLTLQAWRGQKIHFRYGGEAGVVPCKEDGSPLLEGKVQAIMSNESTLEDEDYDFQALDFED